MDRDIFRFHDGVKERAVDPMMIDLRIRKASRSVDFDALLQNFFGPDWLEATLERDDLTPEETNAVKLALSLQMDASEQIFPILYEAFSCTPINDDMVGTTATEIINIYSDYLLFRSGVKKNTVDEPNLSPSTDTIVPSPTTRKSTVSGSTATVSRASVRSPSGVGSGPRSEAPPK